MEPLAERHLDELARVAFDDAIGGDLTQPITDAGCALARRGAREWRHGARVPFATIDLKSDRAIGSVDT